MVERPEKGLRKLQAGWCAGLRSGFEPNKKLEPGDAGAVCVCGSVGENSPEIEELVKELLVKMP